MPEPERFHCPRRRWTGTRDQCGRNTRQGWLVCPACWHQGYDIIPLAASEVCPGCRRNKITTSNGLCAWCDHTQGETQDGISWGPATA